MRGQFLLIVSGYSYAEDYYKQGGYICPSDIFYGRPKRAVNTYGKWKVRLMTRAARNLNTR